MMVITLKFECRQTRRAFALAVLVDAVEATIKEIGGEPVVQGGEPVGRYRDALDPCGLPSLFASVRRCELARAEKVQVRACPAGELL